MIEFHTANTSNGQRVAIMLAECGLPFNLHKYDLFKGEHRNNPQFMALNPAGAIPVIVDPDGPAGELVTLTQSFAIMLYLAEKCHGRFIPSDPLARIEAHRWLMHTATDTMPASGNVFFNSVLLPDKSEANGKWFVERAVRFFGHGDERLKDRDYLAGELSIADFSLYPVYKVREALLDQTAKFDNLKRWAARMGAREGVQKGMVAAA